MENNNELEDISKIFHEFEIEPSKELDISGTSIFEGLSPPDIPQVNPSSSHPQMSQQPPQPLQNPVNMSSTSTGPTRTKRVLHVPNLNLPFSLSPIRKEIGGLYEKLNSKFTVFEKKQQELIIREKNVSERENEVASREKRVEQTIENLNQKYQLVHQKLSQVSRVEKDVQAKSRKLDQFVKLKRKELERREKEISEKEEKVKNVIQNEKRKMKLEYDALKSKQAKILQKKHLLSKSTEKLKRDFRSLDFSKKNFEAQKGEFRRRCQREIQMTSNELSKKEKEFGSRMERYNQSIRNLLKKEKVIQKQRTTLSRKEDVIVHKELQLEEMEKELQIGLEALEKQRKVFTSKIFEEEESGQKMKIDEDDSEELFGGRVNDEFMDNEEKKEMDDVFNFLTRRKIDDKLTIQDI